MHKCDLWADRCAFVAFVLSVATALFIILGGGR